jgi:hypothetical protein
MHDLRAIHARGAGGAGEPGMIWWPGGIFGMVRPESG